MREGACYTDFLAASIICAFRSRRLASLCSAVLSQTAFPPAPIPSSIDVNVGSFFSSASRDSRLYRDIRLGCFDFDDGRPVAAAGGAAGAAACWPAPAALLLGKS